MVHVNLENLVFNLPALPAIKLLYIHNRLYSYFLFFAANFKSMFIMKSKNSFISVCVVASVTLNDLLNCIFSNTACQLFSRSVKQVTQS